MRWVMLGILLVPAFAGCLGDATDETPSDPAATLWAERALPFGPGHDHEDQAQHRGLATPNWEVVGYDPLISSYYGAPAGAYFCGDVNRVDEETVLAAVESRTDVGFAIADVTDPAAPRWLGEMVMQTTHVYDLAVVDGAPFVVLVTSSVRQDGATALLSSGERVHEGIGWRTPCDDEPRPLAWHAADEDAETVEEPAPRPMSIVLVSLEDPARPAIVETQPLAGNGHAVFTTELDGRTWVGVATTRYPNSNTVPLPDAIPGVSPNMVSVYEFFQLVDGPSGPHLELLSVHKRMPGGESGALTGPRAHDLWLAEHPGTGQVLAYLAGGDLFSILDMSDPRQPQVIGEWSDTGPDRAGFQAHLHGAFPLPELRDGRHFTILGPEFATRPVDHPSGIVWVLDTTDPSEIFPVAAWTLPADVEWSGTYMFSNHYFMVDGNTLYISMYHAGLWAIDLAPVGTDDFVLLESIGVFMPDRAPPQAPADPQRWAPTVEEALVLEDGSILTFDGNSGLYIVRFDASAPMPAPTPWPITPP